MCLTEKDIQTFEISFSNLPVKSFNKSLKVTHKDCGNGRSVIGYVPQDKSLFIFCTQCGYSHNNLPDYFEWYFIKPLFESSISVIYSNHSILKFVPSRYKKYSNKIPITKEFHIQTKGSSKPFPFYHIRMKDEIGKEIVIDTDNSLHWLHQNKTIREIDNKLLLAIMNSAVFGIDSMLSSNKFISKKSL